MFDKIFGKTETYKVVLSREKTGSGITIEVQAVGPAQAQRKAESELPGWKVESYAVA